tara:strand:+ start:153 stop:1079 length:927 start_codon:yes stop_codon:yes gene_type:complete
MAIYDWVRWWPEKAIDGFAVLSLEERGAYITVLNLIFARQNQLPDDDRFLAAAMMTSVRQWRRIKRTLIAKKKIQIRDGLIHNTRATIAVNDSEKFVNQRSIAGTASAAAKAGQPPLDLELRPKNRRNSKSKSNLISNSFENRSQNQPPISPQNNDIASTAVPTTVPTTVPTAVPTNHITTPYRGHSPSYTGADGTDLDLSHLTKWILKTFDKAGAAEWPGEWTPPRSKQDKTIVKSWVNSGCTPDGIAAFITWKFADLHQREKEPPKTLFYISADLIAAIGSEGETPDPAAPNNADIDDALNRFLDR